MSNFKKIVAMVLALTLSFTAVGCGTGEKKQAVEPKKEDVKTEATKVAETPKKPDTWIADRTIKGLVFQSDGDASVEMNPEIQAYIKERTGITLELQGTGDNDDALAAGLAAGDLPDFIAFYLNHSGRPEMKLLLKASNEGQFTDLMPMFKDPSIKTYSKYLQDGYLPSDTKDNVMFRKDWNGKSFLVHMSINRNPGQVNRKYVGGVYVKKDIIEKLGIDPLSIRTSQEIYDLAKKIQAGNFVDNNGKPVTAIGPTAWGGSDRDFLYNDLVYNGDAGEKFFAENGVVKHESMTDMGLKRIEYVQKLMKEKLMDPEFYTMQENKAKEGIVNGSFGIIADMHNYITENSNMTYIPLGPINRIDGTNNMVISYKSGYCGWAIPATTKNPEEVFKFADYLASPEGKRLYFYGLEGRDYDMVDGKPKAKDEVIQLKKDKPDEAKKLGFRGVRAYWGEHLGYTDMDNMADFGETEWGAKNKGETDDSTPSKIIKMWNYDEKRKQATVVDGMTAKAFLFEFDGGKGNLEKALDRYEEDLQRAYYAKSLDEAKKIMEDSKKNLLDNGLLDYCKFLEGKLASGVKIKF